jgi:hypothetical protein
LKSGYSHISTSGNLLEVRHLEDGILVFDQSAGATHLLSPAAWMLYCSISNTGQIVESEADASLLQALELAGLVKRC